MRTEEELTAPGIPRGVAVAAAIVMMGFVGSRLLGVVRNIVIGNVFGTSPELDAYFAAFRLPDIVFQLVSGAALASAFIPTFASYLAKNNLEDGWSLASSVLNLVALITALGSLLTIALSPWIVPLIVPGFSPQLQQLTIQLTQVMLISPIFFGASGIIMGILNTRYHFLLPALAPMVYNLSIMGGAIFLAKPWGVGGLAVGVVVGAALHLLVQLPGLARTGMAYSKRIILHHPGVREVGRLMLPRVVGLAAVQVNFLVITTLASTLAAGSLAALTYAWALMMMPLGIFGMAISTAVFPRIAEQAATEQLDTLRRTLSYSLRLILFLTVPASVGLILLRGPLVALLFQRGLFDESSTETTSWALLFYALGLFAHAMLEILTRGFYALRDTKTPVAWSLVAMVLNIALGLVLMGPLGHGGLALGLSLSTILEATALFVLLRRRLGGLEDRSLAVSLIKIVVASFVMAAAVSILLLALGRSGGSQAGNAAAAIGGSALGAGFYLVVALVLRSKEIEPLRARIALKLRQRS